jgi:redox-sensitive bicupin YhaK (pirin superfamily)
MTWPLSQIFWKFIWSTVLFLNTASPSEKTALIYVYRGAVSLGNTQVTTGQMVILNAKIDHREVIASENETRLNH